MFDRGRNQLNAVRQEYLDSYDYSQNQFSWDVEKLGKIDTESLLELNIRLQQHDNITRLDLSASQLGSDRALIESLVSLFLNNPQLEFIDLSNNDLKDEHFDLLLKSPMGIFLQYQILNLAGNPSLTEKTLTKLDEIYSVNPRTMISLVEGNKNFSVNDTESIGKIFDRARNDMQSIEEELKKYEQAKRKYLNDQNSYLSNEFRWSLNDLGPVDAAWVRKLSDELKKHKHVTSLNFNVNEFGRKAGALDALIELLKENTQINTVDLTTNQLRDRHIEKILKLPKERLKSLYIKTGANMLTQESLRAVHGVMAPLTVLVMTSNKINVNDPEIKKILAEANAADEQLKRQLKSPSALNSSRLFASTASDVLQQTKVRHVADIFDEKVNNQPLHKGPIK